jgi:hypothetical protein
MTAVGSRRFGKLGQFLAQFNREWKGSYVCGQGETGLTVTIDEVLPDGRMSGAFEFYPLNASSEGASGRFEIFVIVGDDMRAVQAVPGPWVERPFGFNSVGFDAELREDRLVGKILDSNCGTMDVAKAVETG